MGLIWGFLHINLQIKCHAIHEISKNQNYLQNRKPRTGYPTKPGRIIMGEEKSWISIGPKIKLYLSGIVKQIILRNKKWWQNRGW